MVTINVAYTQAIDPAGTVPVITREQRWESMDRKVREAHRFVPVFSDCKVIEERGSMVVRETMLKPMEGRPGKTETETCKLYKLIKIDFHESTGALITNMVSDGPGMTDEELRVTYLFKRLHPEFEVGNIMERI